jgi:serine/threonine-protein kinase
VKQGPTTKCQPGHVFRQDPAGGGTLPKGGTVTIWVSNGKPKVTIPKLAGSTWTDANQALTKLGLKPVQHNVPGGTKGIVTGTDPGPGQKVTVGSTVRVNVAAGPAINPVPSVVGESLSQASHDLQAAGFNVNPTFVNNNAPANQVLSQNPGPGAQEPAGTIINVTVSNGPPMATVPPVVGETASNAYHDLQAAGFQVTEHYVSVSDPTQANIVQSQNPGGNSQAPQHSIVTINIGQYSGPPTTTATT